MVELEGRLMTPPGLGEVLAMWARSTPPSRVGLLSGGVESSPDGSQTPTSDLVGHRHRHRHRHRGVGGPVSDELR